MSDLSIDDAQLTALGPTGRADLTRRLTSFALAEADTRGSHPAWRWRQWFIGTMVGACLFLIPWIVLLAAKLPPHYIARHWRETWVGFDVALLASLAVTAWAAWRRRYVVILSALIAATLLICDAWFDVTTARHGVELWISIASAVFGELPLAAFLLVVVHRLMTFTVRRMRVALGLLGDVPLHQVRLLTAVTVPAATGGPAGADRVDPEVGAAGAPTRTASARSERQRAPQSRREDEHGT